MCSARSWVLSPVAHCSTEQRMKRAGQDILNPRFGPIVESRSENLAAPPSAPEPVSMTNPDVRRQITLSELRLATARSLPVQERKPWFTVNGEVYDGTGLLDEHPGGADSIWLAAGGKDAEATEDFLAIHSDDAKVKLATVII